MKNRIGLLLAAVMVLNTVSSVAYGFTNPLKSYDLYADTHPGEGRSSSVSSSSSSANSQSFSTDMASEAEEAVKGRNETLRDSSRNVYSDVSSTPAWEEGPSYYENPTLDSIIEKYRKSDFAGCMQECISFVRKHPNDTLGYYYLAMAYTKVNDKDNAIRAYEKVISLNDNPMIVKYATNGRNCIMGNENEKCYPNVNEPELVYPYANIVNTDLTPIDPETLVKQNLAKLREELSPQVVEEDEDSGSRSKKDNDEKKIVLPFGQQDEELDEFINAPYGNGLSPKLNDQYKQIQLRKIRDTINTGEPSPEKDTRDLKYIQKFDNQRSDLGTDKLAYNNTSVNFNSLANDPQYSQQKQQIDELNLLLGNNKSDDNGMLDLIPYMTDTEKKNQNISPEVIQAMMMKSMMNDFNL